MARTRMLSPGFFLDEELSELPPLTRLLFAGLWNIADREGRLEDKPKTIRVQVLPWDDFDCNEALESLQDKGFITRYEVEGCRYVQVDNFLKYQKPHQNEKGSCIPAGQDRTPTNGASPSTILGNTRAVCTSISTSISVTPKDKGKGAGREEPDEKFLEFWNLYPKREGKQASLRCWSTRTKEGATADEILEGTRRYAAYCKANEYSIKHIKLPSTFLGPDKWYESEWKVDAQERDVDDDHTFPTEYVYEPDPVIRRARWEADRDRILVKAGVE